MDYMAVGFRLNALGDAGYDPASARDRPKADYRRTLRGWSFDSDSREGAVLKGWAESRFGLITRFHRTYLPSPSSDDYCRFTWERARALYNTNALEGQLDLVYMFAQHELRLRCDGAHLTLYRGVNGLPGREFVCDRGSKKIMLLNNMSSFTVSAERAGEFGDTVISARVPLPKIFFASNLLPGMLQGEDEHVVVGGLYEVTVL
jgi:NAD+--dinitrogen-reductase ADP-D-ribosyltransferase